MQTRTYLAESEFLVWVAFRAQMFGNAARRAAKPGAAFYARVSAPLAIPFAAPLADERVIVAAFLGALVTFLHLVQHAGASQAFAILPMTKSAFHGGGA